MKLIQLILGSFFTLYNQCILSNPLMEKKNEDIRTQVCFLIGGIKQNIILNPTADDLENFFDTSDIWVDKSLLAKDLISRRRGAVIITCPRKWGKTFNLKMLRHIFEKPYISSPHVVKKDEPDTSFAENFFTTGKIFIKGVEIGHLDKPPLISKDKDFKMSHFRKYPVIYLDFKGFNWDTYDVLFREEVSGQYIKHKYLKEYWTNIMVNPKTPDVEKWRVSYKLKEFLKFHDNNDSLELNEWYTSVTTLSQWLHEFHNEEVIVLIDEYDAIQNHEILTHKKKYDQYSECMRFMQTFMELTFKSVHKSKIKIAILTGIMRTAKGTLLSGWNTITAVNDLNLIDMSSITPFYGFLQYEVENILTIHGEERDNNKIKNILNWYDGYNSLSHPGISKYSPWSIMQFYSNRMLQSYWEQTRTQDVIKKLLRYDFVNVEIQNLMKNGAYRIPLQCFSRIDNIAVANMHMLIHGTVDPLFEYGRPESLKVNVFGSITLNTIIAMLCQAGYLTVVKYTDEQIKSITNAPEPRMIEVKIPNREVMQEMKKIYNSAQFLYRINDKNAYKLIKPKCVHSFKHLFKHKIDSSFNYNNLPSEIVQDFQQFKQSFEELVKAVGNFQDLTLTKLRTLSPDKQRGLQHLSESALRWIFDSILEEFRDDTKPAIFNKFGNTQIVLTDTMIILDDIVTIIEYKSDKLTSIKDVLNQGQAKQYTHFAMSRNRTISSFMYLVINFYQSKPEEDPIIDMGIAGMTWNDAKNFAERKEQQPLTEFLSQNCAVCNRILNDAYIKSTKSKICSACNKFFRKCVGCPLDPCKLSGNCSGNDVLKCAVCRRAKCIAAGLLEDTLSPRKSKITKRSFKNTAGITKAIPTPTYKERFGHVLSDSPFESHAGDNFILASD